MTRSSTRNGRCVRLGLALVLSFGATLGCKPDTPAEEAVEAVEDVLDGRDTPAENAVEAVEDAADEVGRAVRDDSQ
ncbi:MAG: hypothetical protein KC593_17190 [Myxococcales bacterium]|nr:hypothetical protein [Myxococcales bacterium]MCB9626073.1 hypothetical protein [Sandaracinaceae bacterium]